MFISYSHNSGAHRDWVRQLAEQLREKGVDVILDQWDLRPGADVVRFMEQGIVAAERVLMVCTANYVAKAEERKGGAGFEGMIVTGQVAQATETIKFVPIVRDNPGALIPAFLGQRLWLDFRDDGRFDETLLELLHDLHEVPRYVKPPLGPNPFAATVSPPEAPSQPAPPLPPQPAATPPLRPVGSPRREGSEWRLERQELTAKGFEEELGGGLTLLMLEIPAGRFWMGSPPKEPGRGGYEGPRHEVKLRSFFLGQVPITQAQWREVASWEARKGERWERQLNPNPSWFQREEGRGNARLLKGEANTDQRPVETVSWFDAMEFCHRLRQRTGRFYTLPSEAQWEYACRAGTSTPFHFGETITSKLINYRVYDAYFVESEGEQREQTTPVGMFPANGWGLQDMHGNVMEWCLDHWHASYEGAPIDGSAWVDDVRTMNNEENTTSRLLRGGSWSHYHRGCRSAYRDSSHPVIHCNYRGFRICCLPQD
ncbi:MAG: SUMF1/EgtB/PvdO family nonheme iron enzyme [Cyanobacteriota bacterium]|nr:SUMF1/EgtB/PvdO family nonheme iron enzyme [Cyanobacteriota bacterium]